MNHIDIIHSAFHGDPIEALPAIRHLRRLLKQAEQEHIITLRRHGATWRLIGKLLGVSHQHANKTYAHWEPTQT